MEDLKQWLSKYEVLPYDTESFIKMRILVAHEGVNHNRTKFSAEAFENAKPSLANKPILARVIQKSDGTYDFNGHDMDFQVDEETGEVKVVYYEQPIGVIPETMDYEIVEYDGRNYVTVSAYVWRGYTNLAEQIIENRGQLSVSMEIDFNEEDVKWDDELGVYEFSTFRYRGVTMLGEHVQPGMEKAHAVAVYTRKPDEEIVTEYTRMIEVLKEELEMKKSFEQEQPQEESQEEPQEEPVVEENPYETEFKAIFSVESLEQFDREQFTIMPTAEYMQLTDKLSQVETELAELVEYKQQREKADFETKRQAIIDEYSKLLDSEVVEKLANEHKEDLVQLDYALALAVKEEMKNFKQQIGIRIPNDKTFSKSEEKKPKGLAL